MIGVVLVASGCTASPSAPATVAASPTRQPCSDAPELVAAVDLILSAGGEDRAVSVYGDAGGRTNNLMELARRSNFAAMGNPKGEGVIVSLVYAGDGANARDTAHRAGWLILDGAIYPIDVDAAQAFGLLWSGYPEAVKRSAGLGSDYFGMSGYGLDDFIAYNADTASEFERFVGAANELCESPTPWG
jgi:hypothetical protein